MKTKENYAIDACPSFKKRVRIISSGKKALTDCTLDNNEPMSLPNPCFTPKRVSMNRKNVLA